MKLFMTLHINCYDKHEVECTDMTIRQILFDGTAEGEYFNGKILPGGVDTQFQKKDGTGYLSARYILEGTDYNGNPCGLFIQNEADLGTHDTRPKISYTTDAFAFLSGAKLEGKMRFAKDDFMIDIFFEE